MCRYPVFYDICWLWTACRWTASFRVCARWWSAELRVAVSMLSDLYNLALGAANDHSGLQSCHVTTLPGHFHPVRSVRPRTPAIMTSPPVCSVITVQVSACVVNYGGR